MRYANGSLDGRFLHSRRRHLVMELLEDRCLLSGEGVTKTSTINSMGTALLPVGAATVSGMVTAPEIQVLQGTTDIVDGTSIPFDFGSVVQNAVGISKTFTIKNTGNGNLVLQPATVSTGYTITTNFTTGATVLPGRSASLIVRLDSAVLGKRAGSISFANTDANERPFNFAITGRVVAPEVQVLNGTINVADDTGTVAFGNLLQGTSGGLLKTLTIKNTGTSDLKLQRASVTALAGFTIVTNFTTNQLVAPGASANLIIRLDSTTAGVKTATLSFANNDANENPFNFNLTGTVTAPEIQVLQGTTDIVDGTTIAFDFGSVVQNAVGISKTFTIKNTGNGNLVLQPATVSTGYTITTNFTTGATVLPGRSASLIVRLDSAVLGKRAGSISFANTDANERPFNFAITGRVVAPEIQVLNGALNVADDTGTVAFGKLLQGTSGGLLKTLTIKNIGTSDLKLQRASVTALAGFAIVTNFTTNQLVAPGASANLVIRLDSKTVGLKTAMLSFANNDANESPFNFSLTGMVTLANASDLASVLKAEFPAAVLSVRPADRGVLISGSAPNSLMAGQIVRVAEGYFPHVIDGIKVDAHELATVLEAEFPSVHLSFSSLARSVVISGDVPRVATIEQIIRIAKDYYPNVTNNMTVDARELQGKLSSLFPTSAISVSSLGLSVVISGFATNASLIPQIIRIAEDYYPNVIDNIKVGNRSIGIETFTNGQDADEFPGPMLPVGSTATFTYVITNNGTRSANLTNVEVTDSVLGLITNIIDQGDGDNILNVGESWAYEATAVVTAGQYENIVTFTADDSTGNNFFYFRDSSHHFGVASSIDIAKSSVRHNMNAGTIIADDPLRNQVTVSGDSQNFKANAAELAGVLEAEFPAAILTVRPLVRSVLISGIVPSAEMAEKIIRVASDYYPNVIDNIKVDASNLANVLAAAFPAANLSVRPLVGSVLISGFVQRANMDRVGQIIRIAENYFPNVINNIQVQQDFRGLENILRSLFPASTLVVTPLARSVVISGFVTNRHDVGQIIRVAEAYYPPRDVLNNLQVAGNFIDIETFTNGQDADNPTGPILPVGSTATFTYVVTNIGTNPTDIASFPGPTNIVVTDSALGAITNIIDQGDGDNILNVGESWTYETTAVVTAGPFRNLGTVTAMVDEEGRPVTIGDSDESHHFGVATSIDMVKLTNVPKVDNPAAPTLNIGESWTHEATAVVTPNKYINTGTVIADDPLGNQLTVSRDSRHFGQDASELAAVLEGVFPAAVLSVRPLVRSVLISGFVPRADMIGQIIRIAEDYFPNVIDNIKLDVRQLKDVIDTVFPAANISVTPLVGSVLISGLVQRADMDRVEQIVRIAENYFLNVINNIRVQQDFRELQGILSRLFPLAIVNVTPLDQSSVVIRGSVLNPDMFRRIISVAQVYFPNVIDLMQVLDSSIDIQVFVNGQNAGTFPGPMLPMGSTATFTYVVTNNSSMDLRNVFIEGSVANIIDRGDGDYILNVGESWTFEETAVVTAGYFENTVNVTAGYDLPFGSSLDRSVAIRYFGVASSIDIEKLTNGDDADVAPGLLLPVGSIATFTYFVTNNGNVDLTNVKVTDSALGKITNFIDLGDGDNILNAGETWTFEATVVVTAGPYKGTGKVTAVDLLGSLVTDSDDSHHLGVA